MFNNQFDQYGQRNTYEEHQQQQNNAAQKKTSIDLPVKTTIHTEDVKEVVRILNDKPFNESFSLVTFDELNVQDSLTLLNKIISELDDSFKKIKEKPQDQIIFEVTQFLQVLNYPVPTNPPEDQNWQNGLFNAERKIIYPVFYYLTTRFNDLKKRAYLAKFLVPYQVPDVVPMDDEIKKYMDEYKDLQAQFQVTHSQFESTEKESMNPEEIKKEITQLQAEREQLLSKINVYKGRNTQNPQFQGLLEVTNLLRKEQEEEQRIQDRLRQQRAHLEWADQQLLASQQRLFDAKKSVAPENTPEQMLMSVRNEVKKNRELCNERLAVEINEKKKKLEQHEKLLQDPPVTQNELNSLENNAVNLRRTVNIMEDKLSKQVNPHNDKLAIFKQQAALVTKKKERQMQELKRVENEMGTLEKDVKTKQDKLYKERGPGFSNDEFKNFVEQLKVKHAKYKKLNKELAEIKGEISVLARTQKIVEQQNQQYLQLAEKAEAAGGGMDKARTVEDIQQLVNDARRTLEDKKMRLQPQIKQLKELREEFKELEGTYKRKKADYDKIMIGSESDITSLENQVQKLEDEYKKEEERMDELKKSTDVITDKLAKLNQEIDFQKGYKKLSEEHPTYVSQFEAKSSKLETEVKDLRAQREVIKENYEPHQRQIQMFTDLRVLLQAKLQQQSTGGNMHSGQQNYGNVNRLVIDN